MAISRDNVTWIEVGVVAGSTSGIDIDPFIPDPVITYSFVRLTDIADLDFDTGNTAGADIDAVGAISTVTRPADTTAPVISVPADMAVEATGSNGAPVSYHASATDNASGSLTPVCTPAPGDTFSFGQTTVSCTVIDDAGNTASAQFSITVQDTTPPEMTLPNGIGAEATGPNGAEVDYEVSATDLVDGDVGVVCQPPSGGTFPIDSTNVDCSAMDEAGNLGTGTFTVSVVDTTAPMIEVLTDITVEAMGPNGTVVAYGAPAWHDTVDGSGQANCSPVSESTFLLGSTTVTCDATDSHGNSAAPTSFNVTVVDTTAPSISGMPGDITVVATGANGAIVNWSPTTASDLVDGIIEVICNPSSDAIFPAGSTPVVCTASDLTGNFSSASFMVTVVYGVCPQFDQSKAVKAGAVKPIRVQLCTGDGINLSSPDLVLNAVGLQQVAGSASAHVEDPGASNSPDANFRFDGGGYVFNLATGNLTTGTWELLFTVNGGAEVYSVRFDVR